MRSVAMAFGLLLIGLLAPGWSASAVPVEVSVQITPVGTCLTTGSGSAARTLYVFDKDADTPGGSACEGKCESLWPPLLAGAGAGAGAEAEAEAGAIADGGDWTLVLRPNGARQWSFKGRPLYTFARDDTPTATYGDGIGRVWHRAFTPVTLPPGITLHKSLRGDVLADARGHTTYTLQGGSPGGAGHGGQPACSGACLKRWEPVRAPRIARAAGNWSAYDRGDGITQWAYQGEPLYVYVGDAMPGDVLGDGIDKVWRATVLGSPPGVPAFVTAQPSDLGPVLADAQGRTLYAFVGDLAKVLHETCNEECIGKNWIPALATAEAKPVGNWSPRAQPDGTRQWAYKGDLVYTFVHDRRVGDTAGHRFGVGSGAGGGAGSPWLPILQASLLEPAY